MQFPVASEPFATLVRDLDAGGLQGLRLMMVGNTEVTLRGPLLDDMENDPKNSTD